MAALAIAVLLGAGEVLARLARSVQDDLRSARRTSPPEAWFAYSPVLGWERKPGYRGPAGGFDREFDAAGYLTVDSPQVGAKTRPRVIFIGDSNTFGFGAPTPSTFVEVADSLLPDVDAINLGVIGYTSLQGRLVLQKYLPILKPDLVVVSFAYNDRRYVVNRQDADSPEHYREFNRASRWSEESLGLLNRSALVWAFRAVMRGVGLLPSPVQEIRVDAVVPRVDEDGYRRNLAGIAEDARRAGVPLLFLLLRDNPIESQHLREGVGLLGADPPLAIAQLTAGVKADNMFSDLARLYLSRLYLAQGDRARAAEAATSRTPFISTHGGRPIRLDTIYNDIMRAVGAEEGVAIVDAGDLLERHAYDYIDVCHFNADGHRLVGELLAPRMAQALAAHKTAGR
jgi:lysophospholipase L1-like esterase